MPETLDDHVTLQRGRTYKSKLLGEPGPVLLGLASIAKNGGFRDDNLKTYGGESPANLILRPNDIFVSLKDVTQSGDLLGSVARLPDSVESGRLTQDTVKLNFKSDIRQGYIYWLLRTPQYRSHCRGYATGTTNLGLARQDFLSFSVPPLNDQRQQLVSLFDALDDKIELNRRMNRTLESMARALFRHRFLDHPDPAWEEKPASEVLEINPTRKIKKGTVAPYLDMKNVPSDSHLANEVIDREFKSGSKFVNGDTLLARITPCLENGKTAFVDFLNEETTGWGSTEFIVLRPVKGLPVEYGYHLARSDEFRAHAIQSMTGTSGRQRVPNACFDQLMVTVPPPGVAEDFGTNTRLLMDRIRHNDAESRTLASLRDALLPRLLYGEL